MRARHHQPALALEQPDIERITQRARQHLGAQAFDVAFDRGRRSVPADPAAQTAGAAGPRGDT